MKKTVLKKRKGLKTRSSKARLSKIPFMDTILLDKDISHLQSLFKDKQKIHKKKILSFLNKISKERVIDNYLNIGKIKSDTEYFLGIEDKILTELFGLEKKYKEILPDLKKRKRETEMFLNQRLDEIIAVLDYEYKGVVEHIKSIFRNDTVLSDLAQNGGNIVSSLQRLSFFDSEIKERFHKLQTLLEKNHLIRKTIPFFNAHSGAGLRFSVDEKRMNNLKRDLSLIKQSRESSQYLLKHRDAIKRDVLDSLKELSRYIESSKKFEKTILEHLMVALQIRQAKSHKHKHYVENFVSHNLKRKNGGLVFNFSHGPLDVTLPIKKKFIPSLLFMIDHKL